MSFFTTLGFFGCAEPTKESTNNELGDLRSSDSRLDRADTRSETNDTTETEQYDTNYDEQSEVTEDSDSSDTDDVETDNIEESTETGSEPDVDIEDVDIEDTTETETESDVANMACSEKLRMIQVIDKDKTLYSFHPTVETFTEIGEVDCDESLDTTPASMGISRDGVAFINYSNSELYQVSIEDASCVSTDWISNTDGFDRFGMGFVRDQTGEDILYIASEDTLASLNTTTWTVTEIGPLPSQCELTGNSLGELWGFFPLENPPKLRQLDRTNASVLTTYDLPALPDDLDTFAFAFWGGDFYIFYRVYGMGSSTDVYRYNPGGGFELFMADIGKNIVGAGISTCAPID